MHKGGINNLSGLGPIFLTYSLLFHTKLYKHESDPSHNDKTLNDFICTCNDYEVIVFVELVNICPYNAHIL